MFDLTPEEECALAQLKTADNLQRYCDTYLKRRGSRQYECPICGSGTGPKGSAAFSLNGKGRWHCFSANHDENNDGDLLDLIGAMEGIDGFKERMTRAADFCGVWLPDESKVEPNATKEPEPVKQPPRERKATDYTSARERKAERIKFWQDVYPGSEGERYAKERGIDGYPVKYGYDAVRQRLIVPWPNVDWYHTDRDITGTAEKKYLKPADGTVSDGQPIFSTGIKDAESFVVVEGPIDAYALVSLGVRHVVALAGGGYRKLVETLKSTSYQGGVLVLADHDEPGKKLEGNLLKALKKAGIFGVALPWDDDDPKDVDECIQRGMGDKLAEAVKEALESVAEAAKNVDKVPGLRVIKPDKIVEHIYFDDDPDEPIPTGFKELDAITGGGLQRGLYVIGATSSYGKTTISLQIADTVAANGHPVLFVTIEQSAQEIVSKSLSRLTHDEHKSVGGGLTAQEMCNSLLRREWKQAKWDAMVAASNEYVETISPNMRILEGVRRPTVDDVRTVAEDMRAEFGVAPCIFIDYLQLLSPKKGKEKDGDKQIVDANVTELRIMAKELKTPVWCVATLNRESYSGPVEFESFKESGSIEYGADYLMGLQPEGIAAAVKGAKNSTDKKLKGTAHVDKSKRDNPRKVELTLLKNRNGNTTGSEKGFRLAYYPRTNMFVE